VALESVLNGKDERAVDGSTKTVVVPIGVGIIDGDKSGNGGRRRMGIGIGSITTKNVEALSGAQSKNMQ